MEQVDTIAAVATPLGIGGIGVVRMSGPAAWSIAQRVFVRPPGVPLTHLKSHRVYYGFVVNDQGERVDEALLCLMRRPRSYTREDVVEISCHGGVITTQRVLETVLAQGARVAEPGEFTKRAFLHGRLDLTQAEAVIDVINARTLASHRAALQQWRTQIGDQADDMEHRRVAEKDAGIADPPQHAEIDRGRKRIALGDDDALWPA